MEAWQIEQKENFIKTGHEVMKLLYNDFKHYFDDGKILISGSYYYTTLNCPVESEFKDIDLIIDERKEYDYILKEMIEFYGNDGQLTRWEGEGLTGFINIKNYGVDLLRNDFSDNLPPFEIIPGVFTYRQSDSRMLKVYEKFNLNDNSSGKIAQLADFFKQRCSV